jgi:ABC-type antimicrobial peptide transport system permease subunit
LFIFAAVALVLAAIGIYGVMAYLVGQRTRELGIRLALGATPAEVQSLVVRRGALVGATGLALGLAGALMLGIVARATFTVIPVMEPVAYVLAILALSGVVIVASWIPALRASRIDPASTLRSD